MSTPKNLDRRDFIKLAIAGTGAALALQVVGRKQNAQASAATGTGKHSWAMVIDQGKCIGCNRCTLACRASNDVSPEINWTKLYEQEQIDGQDVFISIPCMQCEHAPCVSVCPVGASYYRSDGIVMMDYEKCIGCRYCQVACPYDARSFNWESFTGPNPAVPLWGEPDIERRERGVVEKCSFCYQKIDRGLTAGLTPGVDPAATPACVNACAAGARLFGDLNDPESPVSKALASHHSYRLREELGTGPRVYYLPADHQEPRS